MKKKVFNAAIVFFALSAIATAHAATIRVVLRNNSTDTPKAINIHKGMVFAVESSSGFCQNYATNKGDAFLLKPGEQLNIVLEVHCITPSASSCRGENRKAVLTPFVKK